MVDSQKLMGVKRLILWLFISQLFCNIQSIRLIRLFRQKKTNQVMAGNSFTVHMVLRKHTKTRWQVFICTIKHKEDRTMAKTVGRVFKDTKVKPREVVAKDTKNVSKETGVKEKI